MGPLDRVRKLEEARQGSHTPDTEGDLEERRAALRESLQRAWKRAKREESAGDPRRRRALEELERHMRERVESRRGQHES